MRSEQQASRFEARFRRHYGRVYSLLRRLLGSDEAAEDAAQEVFLRLYHYEQAPADDAALGRWLVRVAMNVGLNLLRSDRRRRSWAERSALLGRADDRDRAEELDPAREAIVHEEVITVHETLDALSERTRTVLVLRHSGFSYAEIASAIGVAPGSVGTLLARAEREFRQRHEARQRVKSAR